VLEIKIIMFFIINILIIFYLIVFPTMAVHFGSRNEWIMKREQAQPIINKIFSEMEKGSRWFEQLRFLILCWKKEIIPKGMRTKISGNLATSEYGRRLKKNHEMKILTKNISELHTKKAGSDQKISKLKMELRETFEMSGNFIENTIKWLWKEIQKKVKLVKIRLKKTLNFLVEEKKKMNEFQRKKKEEMKGKNKSREKMDSRCGKKVVYNNSSRVLSEKEIELLRYHWD